MKCTMCDGEGVVLGAEPDEVCPFCEGIGGTSWGPALLAWAYLIAVRAVRLVWNWNGVR